MDEVAFLLTDSVGSEAVVGRQPYCYGSIDPYDPCKDQKVVDDD